MLRIGITGGIGCGKSAAFGFLKSVGIAVVDADQISHQAVARGTEGLSEIANAFGPSVLLPDGSLDRPGLGRRVFSNPEELRLLEAILHPRIHRAWQQMLRQLALEGRESAFVVIPLLYEKGYQDQFDLVIAIGCSEVTQMQRLVTRGWDGEAIRSRIGSQWSVSRKMEMADRAIWTEGSMESHFAQWRRLLALLR